MQKLEHLYGRPWGEHEYLMVLHYYLKYCNEPKHARSPLIIELSNTLGRTVDSILMRMENYASIDPNVREKRVGLIHINDFGRQLFNKWARRPDELAETADVLIRQARQSDLPDLFNPSPIKIPKAFGKYELLDSIGEGTSGLVFSCINTDSGQPFAIKIIHPHIVQNTEIFHRFIREIHALKAVNHPNVIKLHHDNLDEERQFPAFIMDLAECSLSGYLEAARRRQYRSKRPILPSAESSAIVHAALDAIEALHTNRPKLIHRDVNPNNLLHLADGRWVLADFGLAKFITTTPVGQSFQTKTHRGWGTMWYTAPEQYEDFINSTERTDVYSLGVLIWELFSAIGPPPTDPGLTESLLKVYAKATSRNPNDRYEHVSELRRDFVSALVEDSQRRLW